ncbi:MAG: hypothetical protein E7208_06615 [Clostridium butyricum]|nr:hypothetical protein [Clostridium butyricum]
MIVELMLGVIDNIASFIENRFKLKENRNKSVVEGQLKIKLLGSIMNLMIGRLDSLKNVVYQIGMHSDVRG